MTRLPILLAFVLAGCAAGPHCDGRLGQVQAEIADRDAALGRGYRVDPAQDGKTLLTFCGLPRLVCTEHVQQPRAERRVPVDRDAELAALARLRAEADALRAAGATCN